ncbi:cytidine deaminase [Celerinatantimonas diazotrophica]|uniref:Cytidine deaminase n=1 Tax=Celerinatantimonas diazotrophica TaxID=412034 RepID=A0A4R1JAN8_9GAMM|nr:cytidine deaminase [Celerinatantimonas diazotrophica]TCK47688.1 cytidine deaminase [Celerinatantimonas diazotrophica]CAG9296687.1 Cytidine deaminase [Celerinatantimonas diazotrophica]
MTNCTIDTVELTPTLKQAWLKIIGNSCLSRINTHQVLALKSALQIDELELAQQLLPMASSFAITPISGFQVGAILIDAKGQMFMGANYEMRQLSLSVTLHAEQAAFFNALNHDCAPLTQLVVNAAPCGHCRQFIREYPNCFNLNIFFNGQNYTFEQLLPHSFGPDDLNVGVSLNAQNEAFRDIQELANKSYSPYSGCKIGLIAYQGEVAIANSWYIENAAFNPSASPLSLLLSQVALSDYSFENVTAIQLWMNQSTINFKKEIDNFLSLHPQIHLIETSHSTDPR